MEDKKRSNHFSDEVESMTDYDHCPDCGGQLLEPDGKDHPVLYCSVCSWELVRITERIKRRRRGGGMANL